MRFLKPIQERNDISLCPIINSPTRNRCRKRLTTLRSLSMSMDEKQRYTFVDRAFQLPKLTIRTGCIFCDDSDHASTALDPSSAVRFPLRRPRLLHRIICKINKVRNSQAPPTFECYCQFYGESNLPFCACFFSFLVTPKHPPRLSVIVSFMVSRICHFARVFFLSCLNSVAPG